MFGLLTDARLALRSLLQRPTYAAVAVLTLALGIGATTAIFSVAYGVLLRPLPYRDPDRLALVRIRINQGRPLASIAGPQLVVFRQQSRLLQDMAGLWVDTAALTGDGDPEQIRVGWMTPNLFSLLGAEPARGRGFTVEEADPGGPRAIVLSHELWRRRFGADPEILGRSVTLDDQSWTVVGLLGDDFRLHFPSNLGVPRHVDAWVPLQAVAGSLSEQSPEALWLKVIARLRPDVNVAQVQEEMGSITQHLQRRFEEYAEANIAFDVTLLRAEIVERARLGLLALSGAVAFVLLIACSNVASLALARGADRDREMAIRTALGASPARILRLVLTENLILALAGGMLGVALARWGLTALVALGPPHLPRLEEIGMDGTVLGFSFAVTLLTGLLFGLVPALRSHRPDLTHMLEVGARSAGGSGQRQLRHGLVVTQVALSLVLLIGTGLMLQSFVGLLRVEPGFRAQGLLTFNISLPGARYSFPEDAQRFYDQLKKRIAALPGTESVGAVSHLPLSGRVFTVEYWPNAEAGQAGDRYSADERAVVPGYFETMGTRLLAGRTFTENERADVIIVDEKLARRVWPQGSAVGKRLKVGIGTDEARMEVVGVVEHMRHDRLSQDGLEQIYLPFSRWSLDPMTVVVRATDDPTRLVPSIVDVMTRLDPSLPIYGVRTMEEMVAASIADVRYPLTLMLIFGAVAVLLACVGIYGMLAYFVVQRTREIGIRMAMGARGGEILAMLLRQGLGTAVVGVAVGLVAALAVTRFLTELLFGITPTDPLTYIAISALLLLVTGFASYLPARRATRVDPCTVLRYE